jgi:hypothetical protein
MSVERYIEELFAALGSPLPWDFDAASQCLRAAAWMPLSHGLKDNVGFLGAPEPELLSPKRMGTRATDARTFAGTVDAVCFWIGPLRIPDRNAALVFRAEAEKAGTATPWDSGGLLARCAQHLGEAERKSLIERRTMSAPGYRRALAAAIFVRHGNPQRYVQGALLRATDPDRICQGTDLSSFTYEAQIPGRLRIFTDDLMYGAAHGSVAMNRHMNRVRSFCDDFDVIDDFSEHRTVVDAVRNYYERKLP